MPLHDLDLYRREITVGVRPAVRLSVIDTGAPGGLGAPALLFVHGYAGYGLQWTRQLQAFATSHRVVAPDLRGHGLSDRPHSRYSVDELVGDLEAVVEQLGLPSGFTLLGHSFGGALAASYAARHPSRVERLVLIGTAVDFFSLGRSARIALSLPAIFIEPLRRLVPRRLATPSHVMKAMFRHALSRWDGNEVLAAVKQPCLIVMGERDRVYGSPAYDSVPDRLSAAEVVKISVSGHMVHLERPEAVNRAIARFLREPALPGQTRTGPAGEELMRSRPWLARYETGVPHQLTYPTLPLHQFLRLSAGRFPRRAAIVAGERTLRYAGLEQATDRVAAGLARLEIARGDRVAVLMPNSPELVAAYYGTLKAGATAVSLNPTLDGDTLADEIGAVGARVVIVDPGLPASRSGTRAPAGVTHVVLAPTRAGPAADVRARLLPSPAGARELGWSDLLRAGRGPCAAAAEAGPDDLAVIEFTSGTSGTPKGIMLTHRSLVANVIQVRHWLADLEEGREVVLCALSLWHSYGMTACMNLGLSLGATLVIPRSAETAALLHAIQRHRPTIFPGVPEMYRGINQYPNVRRYGLRSIRACVCGAAPLPVEVLEVFERLTRSRLVEGYGLTEASPITHVNPFYGLRKSGSIGIPLPDTDARIVDPESGHDLPPGQTGELVLRGPQLMKGYWADPERTAQTLRHGWLFTGDLARMDADGYFTLIGRLKDVVRVGAERVYPREVEEVLYEHPGILEAAVTAGAGEEGALVEAHVVLKRGAAVTAEELTAFCGRRLPPHAVPSRFRFRDSLPKTFVGEVVKGRLTEAGIGS